MGVGEVQDVGTPAPVDVENTPTEVSEPAQEHDVDALLAEIEGQQEGQPSTTEPKVEAKKIDPFDFEDDLKWGEKNQRFHYNDIKRYAQMGYAFNEKSRLFNQERQQFLQERDAFQKEASSFKQTIDAYKEVDEYAKANPGWWEHVLSSYKEKASQTQLDPVDTKLSEFEKRVSQKIDQALEKLNEPLKQAQMAEEDKALDSEITAYMGKYPELDWKTVNAQGFSDLEYKILEFADKNQIKNFTVAADAFLKDKLLAIAEAKARATVGDTLKKNAKLGVGPKTMQPVGGLKKVQNVREKSYEEITEEALAELGL